MNTKFFSALTLGSLCLLAPSGAKANPVGASVQAGNVGFQGGAGVLQINQNSPRAIIDWQQFSIGRGELTKFNQPTSPKPSTIAHLIVLTGPNRAKTDPTNTYS